MTFGRCRTQGPVGMARIRKRMPLGLVLAFAATISACAHMHLPAQMSHVYSVHARYTLPGAGRWDLLAVDAQRGYVFVTRGDRVQVMDANGHVVGTVDQTAGVHGVAIAPDIERGFATNGRANTVTEFDLATLRRIRDIRVSGKSPDAVLFSPETGRLFVFNAHSNNASVIDPTTGKEVGVIAFDGNPELAASDGQGRVFVNIEDRAQLVVFDARTLQVLHAWPLQDCDGPTGLALDAANGRVFSACQNGILVVTDANSGRQVARVPIGEGPDGAAFDSKTMIVFVPAGKSGTLTVVHEDDPEHYHVRQTLETEPSARTIALDPVMHRVYLPAARFGPPPKDPAQRPEMLPDSFHVLVVW